MNAPYIGNNDRTSGDKIAVNLVVSCRGVRNRQRSDVLPAQCLFDERVDVHERLSVAEFGEAVGTDNGVQLSLCLLEHVGIERQGKEQRLKRRI